MQESQLHHHSLSFLTRVSENLDQGRTSTSSKRVHLVETANKGGVGFSLSPCCCCCVFFVTPSETENVPYPPLHRQTAKKWNRNKKIKKKKQRERKTWKTRTERPIGDTPTSFFFLSLFSSRSYLESKVHNSQYNLNCFDYLESNEKRMEPDCLLLFHHFLKRQKGSTVVQTKFRSAILNLVFTFILLIIITHSIRSWQRYTRSTVRKTPLVSPRRLWLHNEDCQRDRRSAFRSVCFTLFSLFLSAFHCFIANEDDVAGQL